VERLAYEPFGQRRFPNGTSDPGNTLFGVTTDRGFTSHEHLDEVALIHMNGRVYDPVIGRFTTPDPNVPDPRSLQSFNRYSYVRNNPLTGVDPSGFFDFGGYSFGGDFVTSFDFSYTISADFADYKMYLCNCVWIAPHDSTVNLPVTGDWSGFLNRSQVSLDSTDTYAGRATAAAEVVSPDETSRAPDAVSGGGADAIGAALLRNMPLIGLIGCAAGNCTAEELVLAGLSSLPLGQAGSAANIANKINHIFRPGKNLDNLISASGGSANIAYNAVQQAANQALREGRLVVGPNGVLPGNGAGAVLNINGVSIQLIGGRVIDGVVHIGSFVGL
jgi:RHS repeat-associated protein